MKTTHTGDHERMLEALFVGEAGADAERLRAELESCGTCAPRIVELGRLTQGLSAAGSAEREDLAHAAQVSRAPGSERVASTLRSAMASERAVPARRPRVWPWVAAAGILAALVFVMMREQRPSRLTNEGTLGHARATPGNPSQEVHDFAHFEWTGTLQHDEVFTVEILDPSSTDGRVVDEHDTRELTWDPPAAEWMSWPHRIEWRLRIHAGKGPSWTSSSQPAWRSP